LTGPEEPPEGRTPHRGREQSDALRRAVLLRQGLLAEWKRAEREAAEREEVSQQPDTIPSDRLSGPKKKGRDPDAAAAVPFVVKPSGLALPVSQPGRLAEDFSSGDAESSSDCLRRIAAWQDPGPPPLSRVWWAPLRQRHLSWLSNEDKSRIGAYWAELEMARREGGPGLGDQRRVDASEVSEQSGPASSDRPPSQQSPRARKDRIEELRMLLERVRRQVAEHSSGLER
jgi:hypothetical protein